MRTLRCSSFEEPEAHLHPQLQAAVLSFLEEKSEQSKVTKSEDNCPAGEIQVVVATHSPNLSAWVESKKLVYFRSYTPASAAAATDLRSQEERQPATRQSTRCIPLSKLKLTDPERRKIDRYLDVTKSALLFGGRALLVEGIAEALLLPVIAKNFVLKDEPDKLRRFRSAVFIPIDGVDFAPYVKLLLSPFKETRIAERVVVVTDGDKTKAAVGEPNPGDIRKVSLEAIAKELGAAKYFAAVVNTYSLETELVRAGNGAILKEAYLELHKNSQEKWEEAIARTGDEQAEAIQGLFTSTRKGDFSQLIAEILLKKNDFKVPGYLQAAIEALVE